MQEINLTYIYTLVTIFGVLGYMMIKDRNVAEFFDLNIRWIGVNARRYWMMMLLWPRLQFDMWKMKRWMRKEMLQRSEETHTGVMMNEVE